MKNLLLIYSILLFLVMPLNAQEVRGVNSDTNWLLNWTNFNPSKQEFKEANEILTGNIDKDLKLTKNNVYKIIGTIYVTNNSTLTIEPGTVIRGDKESCGTLVITKGSKIIAEGTQTEPIVFTSNNSTSSRKPGDWGGIVLLGDAPINKLGGTGELDFNFDPKHSQYGGNDLNSNSGILKYVRIEFSGHKINATKELNGLSLAGVGKETKLEYIQISFSNDDSFECYGGDIIFKNLVSFRATDDDFDFTQGAQCSITNSIAYRNPFSTDKSGSYCFEIDSYDKIENTDMTKKLTKIKASNINLFCTEEKTLGLAKAAIYIKERSYFNMNNSIIDGFISAAILDKKIDASPENLAKINIQNSQINKCNTIVVSENETVNNSIKEWFSNEAFSLESTNINSAELYIQPNIKDVADFRLRKISHYASAK